MGFRVVYLAAATIKGINIKEHGNAEIMPEPRKLQLENWTFRLFNPYGLPTSSIQLNKMFHGQCWGPVTWHALHQQHPHLVVITVAAD